MHYAGLLARASKIGSKLYAHIPFPYRSRSYFQQLTAFAMQFLKDEWDESDILAVLLPTLHREQRDDCQQPATKMTIAGIVNHPKGQSYFITSLYKRLDKAAFNAQPIACHFSPCASFIKAQTQ